jgi:hypothetical protein
MAAVPWCWYGSSWQLSLSAPQWPHITITASFIFRVKLIRDKTIAWVGVHCKGASYFVCWCACSVCLPPLAVGVVQLALLGCGTSATAAEEIRTGAAASLTSGAVPLLLQPLLVLPEEAATELETLFQSSAAEAAVTALSTGQDSNTAIAEASTGAWAVLSSLTVDLAFVLSAAQQLSSQQVTMTVTASSAGGGAALPDDARLVLTHLLTHLAGWHCWNMLNFTVQHLASLSAAAAAGEQAMSMPAQQLATVKSAEAAAEAAKGGPGLSPAEPSLVDGLMPVEAAAAPPGAAQGQDQPAVVRQLSGDLSCEVTLANTLLVNMVGRLPPAESDTVGVPPCSSGSSRAAAACLLGSNQSSSYVSPLSDAAVASAAEDPLPAEECGASRDKEPGDDGAVGDVIEHDACCSKGAVAAPQISQGAGEEEGVGEGGQSVMQATVAPVSQLLIVM